MNIRNLLKTLKLNQKWQKIQNLGFIPINKQINDLYNCS